MLGLNVSCDHSGDAINEDDLEVAVSDIDKELGYSNRGGRGRDAISEMDLIVVRLIG